MDTFEPKTLQQLEEEAAQRRAEWPEECPPHFSATSASMLFRCPEQWRRRYVLREKKPPNPNLLWGKADTEAVGWALEQMIAVQEFSLATVGEVFSESIDQQINEAEGQIDFGGTLDPREQQRMLGKIKDAGIALSTQYVKEVAPTLLPTHTEFELTVEHPLWPVPVIGYVDVLEGIIVAEDGRQVTTAIRERKTADRKPSGAINAEWVMQGRIYQMGMVAMGAEPLPMYWDVSVKNMNSPDKQQVVKAAYNVMPDPVLDHRTAILIGQSMKMVEHFYRMYGPDELWPGQGLTHPWACGYCGWRPECGWHA